MHDAGPGRMARRKVKAAEERPALVDYADPEPSAFASMLGGLIEANVQGRAEKQPDFASLVARVGIWVTDIDEGVTLDFKGGKLTVHNGLKQRRTITIRADAETVMSLSNGSNSPAMLCSSSTGRGVREIWQAITKTRGRP